METLRRLGARKDCLSYRVLRCQPEDVPRPLYTCSALSSAERSLLLARSWEAGCGSDSGEGNYPIPKSLGKSMAGG